MLYIIFVCCWNLVSVCLCDCVHRTMMPAPRCHCHWFALTTKPTTLVLLNVYIILLFSWPFASCRFSLFIFLGVTRLLFLYFAVMHSCIYVCVYVCIMFVHQIIVYFNTKFSLHMKWWWWCMFMRVCSLFRFGSFIYAKCYRCLFTMPSEFVCALVVMVTNWYIHFDFWNFVGWCGSDVTVILSSI